MNRYTFLNDRRGKLLLGAYLTVLLYFCRETMNSMYILGFYPALFLTAGITAAMAAAFLLVNRKTAKQLLRDRRIPWAAAWSVVILLPMLIKRDWQMMYFSILFAIAIALFLSFFTDIRETARLYTIILAAFGIFSVVCTYLLRIPADRGILVPPVFLNSFDAPFYHYGISVVSIDFVKNRNFGIFREPGVYQFFLMLAIYLNNYKTEWEKVSQLWTINVILGITMLSTFATGGVLTLGLFVVVLYFDKKWYRTRQGRWIAIGAVGIVLAATAFIVLQKGELYMELFRMLEKFTNGSDSITDRVGSPLLNARLFLSSPMVGTSISETLHGIDNNTSSSTILYAILGIVGGSANVAGWFALVWDKKSSIPANLLLLAILAVAFNTQNLITNPFFWMFPVMAMTERMLPALGKKG